MILASSSPRRAFLLRKYGIRFRTIPSDAQEWTPLSAPGDSPRTLARKNATAKAVSIAVKHPGKWVLGADTIVVYRNQIFGKPTNMKHAFTMLQCLNGQTHQVITAVCLLKHPHTKRVFSATSHVTFKNLSQLELKSYLKKIHPLDKAGSYAAQEHPEWIIEKIRGSQTNVVGLPMERLIHYLKSK